MDGCKKRRTRREKLLDEYLEACLDSQEDDEELLEELIEQYLDEEGFKAEEAPEDEEEGRDARVCQDPICEMSKRELGRKGEDAACALLERKGYRILERNWSCPFGEADIIALDEAALVFVEVKTRAGLTCGLPEESVTAKKRGKYERIAACYLSRHGEMEDGLVRFDVIGIQVFANGKALARHTVNAFGVAR